MPVSPSSRGLTADAAGRADGFSTTMERRSSYIQSAGEIACRTICRRAERLAVRLAREEQIPPEAIQYLNRLSDAFFVWSRWANHALGIAEVLWEPNQAASGTKAAR